MKKQKFNPTPEMIEAAQTLFAAMAWEETVGPIVIEYQKKVLAEKVYMTDAEKFNGRIEKKRITDPKDTYRMNDKDFDEYHEKIKRERDKAGLYVKSDDHCPLLVAENLRRQARLVLVDVMTPITGIKSENIWKTEHLQQFEDLTLKLLAPWCKNPITA